MEDSQQKTTKRCEECGKMTEDGRVGDGDYEGRYFCSSCWSQWDEDFAAPPDFGDLFPPGQEVVFERVPRRPELCGLRGTVVERPWDLDPGRVHVVVRKTQEQVALKAEWLKPFSWESAHGRSHAAAYSGISTQSVSDWLALPSSELQRDLVDELHNFEQVHILDLGSGLGCDATHFANSLGAHVVGLEVCDALAEVIEIPPQGDVCFHCPFDIYQLCDRGRIEALGWYRRFQLLWANVTFSYLTKDEFCELLMALHFLVPADGLLAAIVGCVGSDLLGADILPFCTFAKYEEHELASLLHSTGWKVRFVRIADSCMRPGKWLHAVAVSMKSTHIPPHVKRIVEYHEKSSLGPGGRAKNGSMDWGKQPDKFLRFRGTTMLDLPTTGGSWVARLLRYAFGLAAWKGIAARGVRYSLRTNASSGALQPLEFYILADSTSVSEYDGPPALLHYHSYWHALQILTDLPASLWSWCKSRLPTGSILVAITAFYWRNAWKYGEPGFRYVQQDVGHAIGALGYAALTEGAQCKLLEGMSDSALASLLGLEDEHPSAQQPQALIAVCPGATCSDFSIPGHLLQNMLWKNPGVNVGPLPPACCDGHRASWKHRAPPRKSRIWQVELNASTPVPWNADELRSLILQRRSCHELDPQAWVDLEPFLETLRVAQPNVAPFDMLPFCRPLVPLVLFFVNRVRCLAAGLYAFVRDESRLDWLRSSCFAREYLWKKIDLASGLPLFLLTAEDVGQIAQQASAGQEIARTGVASCAVFIEYQPLLCNFGAWMYRRAHWEAGMVVQAMYLASEAIGLRGTAMGAFLGPWVHDTLGVSSSNLQDVEHWTFGHAIEDERLETSDGYHHLSALRARDNAPAFRDTIDTKQF